MAATVVDLFAEIGEMAFRSGALTEALTELTIRVDLAGGGDLLAEFARTCWTPGCACGHEAKGTPNPHPKPPPPPPPPPPGQK